MHDCQRWQRLGMNCPIQHRQEVPQEDDDDDDQDPETPEIPKLVPIPARKPDPPKQMDAVAEAVAVVEMMQVVTEGLKAPAPQGGGGGTGAPAPPPFRPPVRTAQPAFIPSATLEGTAGSTPAEVPTSSLPRGEAGFFPGERGEGLLLPLAAAAFAAAALFFRNFGPGPLRLAGILAPLVIPSMTQIEEVFTATLADRVGPSATHQSFEPLLDPESGVESSFSDPGDRGGGFLKDMSQQFAPPPGFSDQSFNASEFAGGF